jgi:hypothetical protein
MAFDYSDLPASAAQDPRNSSRGSDRWQQRLLFASVNRTPVDYTVIRSAYRRKLSPRLEWEETMKLCGQISVELNVGDYVEAADHQKRLEDILRQVRAAYPEATLSMRERRERKVLALTRAAPGLQRLA